MAYAEGTVVPIERSIAEIIGLVKAAGAVRIMQFDEPEGFIVQFEVHGRLVRFSVGLPAIDAMPVVDGRRAMLTLDQRRKKMEQAHRQKARALLLVIKAKLESVESEVETFEQAFLPNVVMADGATVYDRIQQPIADEYTAGIPSNRLLPPPRRTR